MSGPAPLALPPKSASPPKTFGALVKNAREARGRIWTQGHLAAKVGVTRECIARLELQTSEGGKMPGHRLAEALLREFGPALLQAESDVSDYPLSQTYDDVPDLARSERGFRAYAARLTADLTQVEVARPIGLSAASLSLFERGAASPRAIVGRRSVDDGRGIERDAYALALGFAGARDMNAYLDADDPLPWLARIAEARGRRLPPAATLPTRRAPLPAPVLSALQADLMDCY